MDTPKSTGFRLRTGTCNFISEDGCQKIPTLSDFKMFYRFHPNHGIFISPGKKEQISKESGRDSAGSSP